MRVIEAGERQFFDVNGNIWPTSFGQTLKNFRIITYYEEGNIKKRTSMLRNNSQREIGSRCFS
jgi:hypothetical protein